MGSEMCIRDRVVAAVTHDRIVAGVALGGRRDGPGRRRGAGRRDGCLLYTSDAADERLV